MNVQIRDRGVPVSARLRAHVHRRLDIALARYAARVARVTVRFSNGRGRREAETRCEIEVSLRPKSLRAEDTDTTALGAFDHAAGRASRSLALALADERHGRERT